MDQETLQHAENWAVATFGAAELGDPRRTDRLVKVASALAKNPSASLPHALETWGETLGAYRFLNNPTLDVFRHHHAPLDPDLSRRRPLLSDAPVGRHNRDRLLDALGPGRIGSHWQLTGE